jgi:hypothetical protein
LLQVKISLIHVKNSLMTSSFDMDEIYHTAATEATTDRDSSLGYWIFLLLSPWRLGVFQSRRPVDGLPHLRDYDYGGQRASGFARATP